MRANVLVLGAMGWALTVPTACGRLGFNAPRVADASPATDSTSTENNAASDAFVFGPWSAPVPLISLNTSRDDSDPDLRADGLELVFHSNQLGGAGGYDLYRATRANRTDPFSAPEMIVPLATAGDELGPSLSSDALTLMFSNGQDIMFATRINTASPFGAAQLVPALSSADVDTAPALSGNGQIAMIVRGTLAARELWIYSRTMDGPLNIGWTAGALAAELNSTLTESSPELDDAGRTVYFHGDRIGINNDDIFTATRTSITVPFATPMPIPELMSSFDDGDPTLTDDGRMMVFHRELDLQQMTR